MTELVNVLAAIVRGFPGFMVSGFVECFLLAAFVDAAVRGRRIYGAGALGMATVLLARMAEGLMQAAPNTILRIGGLLLAGIVVFIDLVTEVVDEPREEPQAE